MALTFGTRRADAGKSGSAPLFVEVITITGDNPYASGGYANFSAFISKSLARTLTVVSVVGRGGQYTLHYDIANDKLMVFDDATGLEAGAIDLSAVTFTATIIAQ